MRVEIRYEDYGWPKVIAREYSPKASISEITEKLLEEEILPKEGESVYLLKDGCTDQELASFYPMMRKVIRITEAERLREIWQDGVEPAIQITKVETMKERLEQIRPYLPPEPVKENPKKKRKGFMDPVAMDQPNATEDQEEKIATPYEKEKMLLDIGLSVTGEDALPPGATTSLWLYLLGFVLIAAFMVRTLVGMLNYDAVKMGISIWQMVGQYAVTCLLPAAICFGIGFLVEYIAKAREEKAKKDK